MGDSFFIYLEQLELLFFFSGYLLIYLFIRAVAETGWTKKIFAKNISTLLPYSYALVGVLYLGFLLKSLYPDYSMSYINAAIKIPALKIWALSSILFFVPRFAKNPVYSLLHSLVFIFFIFRHFYFYLFKSIDKSVLKNDMNLYAYSLLINIAAFFCVMALASLYNKLRIKKPD
jgi:hypothetical protein